MNLDTLARLHADYRAAVTGAAGGDVDATAAAIAAGLALTDPALKALPYLIECARALEFYAESRRYNGPNSPPIPGDRFARFVQIAGLDAYCFDVTKDRGAIAGYALLELQTVLDGLPEPDR